MQYVWLIWSLFTLLVWLILYLSKPAFRKEMMSISLGTMLLGFTEPLFVPEYWNPPTLFDLAQRTGFDIESLIFTFAIGGTGSVLYRVIYKKNIMKLSIVIPVFNEKETILKLLEKLDDLVLPESEKEIIVVDDFSADGTRELLKSLEEKYNILFHRTPIQLAFFLFG